MSSNCLVDTPPDVLTNLVQQWLSLKEIVRLDTAICNRRLRNNFCPILSRVISPEQPEKKSSTCGYFKWLLLKRIAVKSISVHNGGRKSEGWSQPRKQISILCNMDAMFRRKQGLMSKWLCKLLGKCHEEVEVLNILTVEEKNVFTPLLLDVIGTCTNLRCLQVWNHLLHDTSGGPPPTTLISPILQRCQKLEALDLCDCSLSKQDALQISTMLQSLTIETFGYPAFSPQTFSTIVTRCTGLTRLCLTERGPHLANTTAPLFNPAMYLFMSQHLARLRELSITMDNADYAGLEILLIKCTELQSITLNPCLRLNNATFTAMLQSPSLLELRLFDNLGISGVLADSQAVVATNRLQRLTLSNIKRLTDSGMRRMLEHCPALTELHIAGSTILSVSTVDAVAQYCPKLVELSVHRCPLLTRQVAEARVSELGLSIEVEAAP